MAAEPPPPPEEREVPAAHELLSPGVQCWEEKSPQPLRLSETEGCGFAYFPLKGPRPALLANGLAPSELQCWGSGSRGSRDVQGGAEVLGFRTRAGGAACSQTEVQAEATVPLLSPPRSQPTDTGAINWDNTGPSAQGIPRLYLSQLVGPPNHFQ